MRTIGTNEKGKGGSDTNLRKEKGKQIMKSNRLNLKARNQNKDIYKKKSCEAGWR